MAEKQEKTPQSSRLSEELMAYCRDIPDFPKKGIIFKDITNILKNGAMFRKAIDGMAANYSGSKVDAIVCVEARGFMVGSALAYRMGCGLVPVRKKGKLPWKTFRQSYDLEYGQDQVEIHQDGISPGQNVLLVDDIIATGGTMQAVMNLAQEMRGNIVGAAFLMELAELGGRSKLAGVPVFSLLRC